MSYNLIVKQIESLISDNEKQVSVLANVCAILKEELKHFWIGFYIVDEEKNEMYLGPFQGPLACTKIPFGKGVCGASWEKAETLIVPDVHKFPGHIACSSQSNSEIVVPVIKNNKVVAVLDIDSTEFDTFNEKDKEALEKIANIIAVTF